MDVINLSNGERNFSLRTMHTGDSIQTFAMLGYGFISCLMYVMNVDKQHVDRHVVIKSGKEEPTT